MGFIEEEKVEAIGEEENTPDETENTDEETGETMEESDELEVALKKLAEKLKSACAPRTVIESKWEEVQYLCINLNGEEARYEIPLLDTFLDLADKLSFNKKIYLLPSENASDKLTLHFLTEDLEEYIYEEPAEVSE